METTSILNQVKIQHSKTVAKVVLTGIFIELNVYIKYINKYKK